MGSSLPGAGRAPRRPPPAGDWSYDDALAYLGASVNLEALVAGRFEPPTLERMTTLCGLMADPQHAQPAVHVTGTNGKGSTARMVTALLAVHGLTVGTYTSPHLVRVNERIARNGEAIDDADLAGCVAAVAQLEDLSGVHPSHFEILTLAAYRWFADLAVDAAVVEVGMGGRWDATNVVDAVVSVVTNVGLDHTGVLGPTRADIAREKAGIVRPGGTLVLGETDPELASIFVDAGPRAVLARGREFGCTANRLAVGGRLLDLQTPGASYRDVFLPLHGAHQGDNAAVAVATAEAFFGRPVEEEALREALASVAVPGRFEIVGRNPLLVLDGAHNPDGCRAVAATLGDFSGGGERVLVVGMNRGRSPEAMFEALAATEPRLVVACAADWPRALPAEEVAAAARATGVEVEVVPRVAEAVRRALAIASADDAVLVTGSLHAVGAARAALVGDQDGTAAGDGGGGSPAGPDGRDG
ncbi:MAG: bifunctional folylpolyglutamate synthase/dihydrofolate synthase [Actinobacteria bacterium]|nr:bifunctional folylpolyglutamate synthase/dihydrofolate synthase [Actinomycetota bacterium]